MPGPDRITPDGRVVKPADDAREQLARAAMTLPAFTAHLRRFAESHRWRVVGSDTAGVIKFLAARRGRLVVVCTDPWDKLTPADRDFVDDFGDAGAEVFHLPPSDVDGAEAVFV